MKKLRLLLFPFSILYGLIMSMRNYFYDLKWFPSQSHDLPIICVGNLNTGGTGKSPMIELLISILKTDYKVAVLSRGYKRKTVGYIEVKQENTAQEVGDEPLQFKSKFPDITVAVNVDRNNGIGLLKNAADLILLDDAFQHRKVNPSFTLLLTTCNDLYRNDFLLPAGNLREPRSGVKRADVIVVTKCKSDLTSAEMDIIESRLQLNHKQHLFFSSIIYDDYVYSIAKKLPLATLLDKRFTLVTGIADPKPLIEFLTAKNLQFEHLAFPDHHNFSESELEQLKTKTFILATEKDFMRLKLELKPDSLFYIPIKTKILNNKNVYFEELILTHVNDFRKKNKGLSN